MRDYIGDCGGCVANWQLHFTILFTGFLKIISFLFPADVLDAWTGTKAHVILSKIGASKLFDWDIHQGTQHGVRVSEVQ